jgi:hypothetical protein
VAQIFISHIHEEEKIAKATGRFLASQGYDAFLSSDDWQVFAGEEWLQRIKAELGSATIVLLLLSAESVQRPWVNFEAGGAWLTGKLIIPACFAGLTKGRLPKPYSNLQALDIRTDYYYLIRSIQHHLKPQALPPLPFSPDDANVRELVDAVIEFENGIAERRC